MSLPFNNNNNQPPLNQMPWIIGPNVTVPWSRSTGIQQLSFTTIFNNIIETYVNIERQNGVMQAQVFARDLIQAVAPLLLSVQSDINGNSSINPSNSSFMRLLPSASPQESPAQTIFRNIQSAVVLDKAHASEFLFHALVMIQCMLFISSNPSVPLTPQDALYSEVIDIQNRMNQARSSNPSRQQQPLGYGLLFY